MMSSRYDLYGLGYSRATTVRTKRSKNVSFSNTQKTYLSSDCTLKIGYMKRRQTTGTSRVVARLARRERTD
jgi:hypothetical protein